MRALLAFALFACGGNGPTEIGDADRTKGCYVPLTLPDLTVVRVWHPVCPDTLKVVPPLWVPR